MDFAQYLNMNRQRNDLKGFENLVHQKRDFPYLINRAECNAEKRYVKLIGNYRTTAITITCQRWLDDFDDMILRDILYDALNYFEHDGFVLYPDLDANANRHWHGIITITRKELSTLKRYFTKHFGFVKFEYIKDSEGWFKYMRKDKGFTSKEHPSKLREPIYTDDDIKTLCVMDNMRAKDGMTIT